MKLSLNTVSIMLLLFKSNIFYFRLKYNYKHLHSYYSALEGLYMQSAIKQFPEFDLKASYPPYEIYELKTKRGRGEGWGSHLNRLSENANSKNQVLLLKDF